MHLVLVIAVVIILAASCLLTFARVSRLAGPVLACWPPLPEMAVRISICR